MGKIIAVVSGKGGTGKTSFTANVGLALAALGKNTLCLDCDITLRNLDLALGLTDKALMDFSDVIAGRCSLSDAAADHPKYPKLHLLTAPLSPQGQLDVTDDQMRQLLDGLPARERQIILLRYGLSGQPPLTQLETAKLLDISRSYVSRLETHALELLRQRWDVPGTKNSAEVNGVLTPAPCNQLSRIFNCSSSNCSKVYSRFSASTSSFLERRGGRPSAFRSFALRSALPGLPESPHS